MAVRVKISRLMTIMRMMHSWLLNQWRRTLVPMTVLIEVAGHMALVRVVGAGLGGGLGGHTYLTMRSMSLKWKRCCAQPSPSLHDSSASKAPKKKPGPPGFSHGIDNT